jgi:amphi-Trp domain-containing protein
MIRRKRVHRDIEKDYPRARFVAKVRRLADCIEQGKAFRIQVAGERIVIPSTALINIEHERAASGEELEFQLRWKPAAPRRRS